MLELALHCLQTGLTNELHTVMHFHSSVESQELHDRSSHIFGVLTEKLSSPPVYEHRCCKRLFPHTNKQAIPWFRVKDVICFLLTQTMPRLSTLFEGAGALTRINMSNLMGTIQPFGGITFDRCDSLSPNLSNYRT